jgi:hypothetical protein
MGDGMSAGIMRGLRVLGLAVVVATTGLSIGGAAGGAATVSTALAPAPPVAQAPAGAPVAPAAHAPTAPRLAPGTPCQVAARACVELSSNRA